MSAQWRLLQETDLTAVVEIADTVHVGYPEDEEVLREKFDLYPKGCFLLEIDRQAIGYFISHPWIFKQLPALNKKLGALPEQPTTYYIHDIALLPAARGTGASSAIMKTIVEHAKASGFNNMSLTAVNDSIPFWEKQGFVVEEDPALSPKLKTYDDDARFMVKKIINA